METRRSLEPVASQISDDRVKADVMCTIAGHLAASGDAPTARIIFDEVRTVASQIPHDRVKAHALRTIASAALRYFPTEVAEVLIACAYLNTSVLGVSTELAVLHPEHAAAIARLLQDAA